MEPRFLLDTNICIYIRQERPAEVLRRFRKLRAGEAALSVITYGELLYGAAKSTQREAALERLRELLARLKHRLGPRGQILLDSTSPRAISSPLKYAGECELQLQYRSLLGKPFPWLWVDFSVLSICARAAGYDAELLTRGSIADDYLARLTPQ